MVEGEKLQYMLLLHEKQAFFMFNEIAKSEGVDNLCLPMLFKLRVEKGHSQSHSLLSMMDHAGESDGIDFMEDSAIIDFRFIS